VVPILNKHLFLLVIVFVFGCNNAEDVTYDAKLEALRAQESLLNKTLEEQQKIINVKQEKRLEQFVELGGTVEEFDKLLELEHSMSTEEIIKSTESLKKQIEDQNRILSSLKEEAANLKEETGAK